MFLCRRRPSPVSWTRSEGHRRMARLCGGGESSGTEVKDQAKVFLFSEGHPEGTS